MHRRRMMDMRVDLANIIKVSVRIDLLSKKLLLLVEQQVHLKFGLEQHKSLGSRAVHIGLPNHLVFGFGF